MSGVLYGGVNDANALLYGRKHPNAIAYLEQNATRFQQYLEQSPMLTDAGRMFFQQSQEAIQQVIEADAMRYANAALRKVQEMFQPDIIKPLWDLAGLQTASLTMQRWIMADPTVRELYQQQRLDGFSDTYVDMHPGTIADSHYDYRQVMHGLMQDDPDDPEGFKVSFYFDELVEGDRELVLDEKIAITSTWDIINAILKRGDDDPTSALGGKL